MNQAIVAHSLVAAHAERVREFARLYGLLERAVAASGADDDAARHAYRRLTERIVDWEVTDLEAERRDVVTLGTDEREALRNDAARAITYAERHAVGQPPTAREHAVVRELYRIEAAFPTTLTRAALARFRSSAARLKRIEALRGPAFALGTEAGMLLGALETATAPIVRPDIEFDPEHGFHATFVWGLRRCILREPSATGAVDLGLGISPAVAALLGVSSQDLDELYERWVRSADLSHPFARYPYVPHGRFCAPNPARLVRGDLDSTGPIGWAAGDDEAQLARDLLVVAGEQTAFARDLGAVANRVESAAQRGEAVIGFVEYLPPEAEGDRQWFIDLAGDNDR